VLAVEYNVLALSVARPIEIAVYDLAGRRVRTLHDGPEQTGRYEDKSWDGRDEEGKIVPPGMYIVRIVVEGDSQQEEQSRAVAVVY
jgi:flagellar hook assembly protein FlgD